MVDAGQAIADRPDRRHETASGQATGERWRTTVLFSEHASEAYSVFCAHALQAPPQGALWTESWARPGNFGCFTAILEREGRPVLALALEIVRTGPFRVARWVGGNHANGNFPVLANGAGHLPYEALKGLAHEIHHALPDIDLLTLERQIPAVDGIANPLLALPHRPSPNIALATDLSGGFEALLSRVNGKRKRKKYRSQLRKFEEAGGFRRFRAKTAIEVETLFSAFLEMKRQRFAAQGIADVFAPTTVQTAFRTLFNRALESPSPTFFLHGLEVGGIIRAVSGSSLAGRRLICDFCAFADDDLAATSPGDFLFFENIREACEEGFEIYDFSVGEERYKRAWCDIETTQFDVFLPLTPKGRVLAYGRSALSDAKRMVKNNPALWTLAKKLRASS